jgi:hypothetical protein
VCTTEGDIFDREEDGSNEIITRVWARKPERLSAVILSRRIREQIGRGEEGIKGT